jgi:hypothetical protein
MPENFSSVATDLPTDVTIGTGAFDSHATNTHEANSIVMQELTSADFVVFIGLSL